METNEENKIQEAEIVPAAVKEDSQEKNTGMLEEPKDDFVGSDELNEEDNVKKTKSEFRSRLMLVFVLGFLIGIAIKTEALKKITIGYNDYLMKIKSQSYDINGIQTKLQSERDVAAQTQDQQGTATDSGAVDESEGSAPVSDGEQSTPGATSDPAQN